MLWHRRILAMNLAALSPQPAVAAPGLLSGEAVGRGTLSGAPAFERLLSGLLVGTGLLSGEPVRTLELAGSATGRGTLSGDFTTTPAEPGGVWIMATNSWNDAGVWDDAAAWMD